MLLLTNQLEEVELYITAPLYIYKAERLSLFDKLLFTSIYGLTKTNQTTVRPDVYFMELLDKSDKTIAKSMKRLDDYGFIKRETYFNRITRKRSRKIRLVHKTREVVHAPMEIYLHDLTDGAKMLLIQLVGLSKKDGYTFVRNKELSEKMDIGEWSVNKYLKELREKNFIFIEGEQSANRIIVVNDQLVDNSIIFEEDHKLSENLLQTKKYVRLNFKSSNDGANSF